ncbi:MAG: hypothetical protein DLM61_17735 [Pseudonocardiales bacterium]|nr:MAG: hypothetical protein DLM61_17735 [Pseudonocardiales bacterium]
MTPEYRTIWAAPGSLAEEPVEIRYVLHAAAAALRVAGSASPRLDADVLLAHALGISRAQLYARLRDPWPPDALGDFGAALRRRLAGEPVAYIVGHKDFYGLDLAVDADGATGDNGQQRPHRLVVAMSRGHGDMNVSIG